MCGDCGCGETAVRLEGRVLPRRISLEADLLADNEAHARAVRTRLDAHGILALNLISAPGAGKTTLLVRTLEALRDAVPLAVIEGDQETDLDARRIRATGARTVQINTGAGCHLDARGVAAALARLDPPPRGVLFIENVGNLVCPSAFDLGEHHKVALLSVTEGEDKPLKYPALFHKARLLLITKTDLLPYLDFDLERCVGNARRVNPELEVIPLSARTGEGVGAWLDWIRERRER